VGLRQLRRSTDISLLREIEVYLGEEFVET